MLGLKLREEFRGRRLKGTAIELATANKTGATQRPAEEFLEITYPTSDVAKAIESVGPDQSHPIVLIGERGLGKSHLMGVLYHVLKSPDAAKKWLQRWSKQINKPELAKISLRGEMAVFAESLQRQHYKYLWDILFERHPKGERFRGKWDGQGGDKSGDKTPVPPQKLIIEMLQDQPVALLLDEYQTWYDGLTDNKQFKQKTWAFNFIQNLTEIAKNHPDLLVLVVSVRNGSTDAYQQIHRENPVRVDFKGQYAKRDRKRLLLHRLFENRIQIAADSVKTLVKAYTSEYLRLLDTAPAKHQEFEGEVCEAWPFSPVLLELLEAQVLVATQAQETRDLIRILAELYKSRGEKSPVLTPADFALADEQSGIAALLESVSSEFHRNLRKIALSNIESVSNAVTSPSKDVPHLDEIIGALWLRSVAVEGMAGAEARTLQSDITRESAVDDNLFEAEMSTIEENSFNIHKVGERFLFKEEVNADAKLRSTARNDKIFDKGQDKAQIAKEVRYVLSGPEEVAKNFHVIVLHHDWRNDPWTMLEEGDRPDRWDDRLPIIAVPERPERDAECLGRWLNQHLSKRRNVPRFLLPKAGTGNVYDNKKVIFLARLVLKAGEWQEEDQQYQNLYRRYQKELRDILKAAFPTFAVLDRWCYADPARCQFQFVEHRAEAHKIPDAIEEKVRDDLFALEDFSQLVLEFSENNDSFGKLLKELQEPTPNEEPCIPWLGELQVKERVIRLCAKGKIALNLRNMETLQTRPGETETVAWNRMKSKLGTGKFLDETYIQKPGLTPAAGGVTPPVGTSPIPGGATGTLPGMGGEENGPAGGTDAGEPLPPSPFGTGTTAVVPFTAPATSSLNLLGKLEVWGINEGSRVQNLRVKVGSLTGAQLKRLLEDLPDGLTYGLELDKEG